MRHLNALTSKAGLLVFQKDWDLTRRARAEVDPKSPMPPGWDCESGGHKEEAWAHFDRAYENNPRLWQALLEQGTMALDSGDLPLAVQKLEKVLTASPTAQVLTILGTAYARMGDSEKATAAFKAALRIDPSFVPARQALSPVVQK
jgi:tetratricopeptide (TPR) repeat protein